QIAEAPRESARTMTISRRMTGADRFDINAKRARTAPGSRRWSHVVCDGGRGRAGRLGAVRARCCETHPDSATLTTTAPRFYHLVLPMSVSSSTFQSPNQVRLAQPYLRGVDDG